MYSNDSANETFPAVSPLTTFAVVLVELTHPGNIGAAARAMKTMGLSDLRLVNPLHFPHADATAMASGADDLLQTAKVFADLDEAIADCHWVVASSARTRQLACPHAAPRELAPQMVKWAQGGKVAILFGRERIGLTNDELARSHYLLHIPVNPVYGSLNVASAVQLIAYELRLAAALSEDELPTWGDSSLATAVEVQRFHEHLAEVLREIDFLDDQHPRQLLRRLRRLFNRTALEHHEVQILRGILTHLQKAIKRP